MTFVKKMVEVSEGLTELGQEVILPKFTKEYSQMDNLPYYMMIADEEMKIKVMWKHNFFINFFAKEYSKVSWFQKYQQMVESFKK